MPYANEQDVVVSPAWIWRAPKGTAAPTPNQIGVGNVTYWTGWTPIGYTLTPLTVSRTADEFGVDVQQSTTDVRRSLTGEEFTLSSEMAELSPTNVALLLAGTTTVTPAGVGQVGYSEVDFGGSTVLPEFKWGVEWIVVLADGTELTARLILYRGTIAMDGDLTLGEGEAASMPFTITALADGAQPVGQQIGYFQIPTAAATG